MPEDRKKQTPAARQPTMMETVANTAGQYARAMFPRLAEENRANARQVQAALDKGDIGRAVGGLARGAVAPVGAAAIDIASPVVNAAITGVPAMLGGFLGSSGDTTATQRVVDTPMQPLAAVDQALAQGRGGPANPITPQDRMSAFVDSVFSGPLSLRQARLAAGVLPAPGKPPSAKDNVLTTAAGIADTLFEAEIAKAGQIKNEAERDAARAKATDKYFQQYGTLYGADMAKLAFADFESED